LRRGIDGYGSAVRNRYLDLLRAAAILRVIVYHLFGWPWLTILLPAMGVMFALAGSLMAASLDTRKAGKVVTSRLRRLLPPLWAFGLIAVPVMLWAGWAHEDGDYPLSLPSLAFWLVPVGDPPGSQWGIDLWEPLWYLRAYLWFVALSPVLYWAYKRVGWFAVAAPILLIAVLDKTGFSLPDVADTAMWDFAAYGACWIAGFAHHDGRLARLRPSTVIGASLVLGVAAMYWLQGHPGEEGIDLNDVPESQALWSLAFVLLALRWTPDMGWLERSRPMAAAVTLLNARAVTIYLWHNVMIAIAWPLLAYLTLDDLGVLNGPVTLATVLALTAGCVVLLGWVEDLAARRRPRLWPAGTARAKRAAAPAADQPTADPSGADTPTAAIPTVPLSTGVVSTADVPMDLAGADAGEVPTASDPWGDPSSTASPAAASRSTDSLVTGALSTNSPATNSLATGSLFARDRSEDGAAPGTVPAQSGPLPEFDRFGFDREWFGADESATTIELALGQPALGQPALGQPALGQPALGEAASSQRAAAGWPELPASVSAEPADGWAGPAHP
jgi:peptidoglycan/LPS O-acetylase OafA/YrhL